MERLELEKTTGLVVHRLDRLMGKNISRAVKEEGMDEITMLHGWIIRYLYEHREEEVFQKDIEQSFSTARSSVTGVIQVMEKRGFLRRETVERDARLKKLVLTEKGINSHEKMGHIIENVQHEVFAEISDEDMETVLRVGELILAQQRKLLGEEEDNG